MTGWQRPARLALLLVLVAVVVAVALSLRPRAVPETPTLPPTADPDAVMESTGAVVTQASGVREDYTLEYARRRTYEDGTTQLDEVIVQLTERAGRDFEITANEGRLGNDETLVTLLGDVVTTGSDGLRMTTDRAEYNGNQHVVRAPGEVTFAQGAMSGTGRDAVFQERQDVLVLREDPVVEVSGDEGSEPLVITAGRARIARREREVRFQEDVRAVEPGQIVEAADITMHLQDTADTLRLLALRGDAQIVWPDAGAGALDGMIAENMDLTYADDGRTLEHALLDGGATLSFRGAAGAGRRLVAARIELGLGPDGVTLVSLDARDQVELSLPASEGSAAQRIRAAVMTSQGTGDTGLTAATFSGGVEFREETGEGEARVTTSRTLDAALAPTTGDLRQARFNGDVAFTDGAVSGTAPEATYDIEADRLAMRSSAAQGGVRLSDPRMTIDATAIDLGLGSSDITADGEVRSVLKPQSPAGTSAADSAEPEQAKLPAILESDSPVNVTAAHLELSQADGTAVYTGDARLWQGETAVQAESITLYDETGDLRAIGNVRSTMRLEEGQAGATSSLSVATAENLLYEEARQVATYTDTARVIGPQGDLRAVKIELYLDEAGGALERAEAYEQVALDTDRRSAAGTRLTYFVEDERYVMSGAPVMILEQLPQECRETLGKTLTFFRSTDTISVDGNEQSRTQTRSGERCPEPLVP